MVIAGLLKKETFKYRLEELLGKTPSKAWRQESHQACARSSKETVWLEQSTEWGAKLERTSESKGAREGPEQRGPRKPLL